MPVSPLSTPLKTEYKPLGLEMFAQPLSDMQAKYDTAKAAINDTTYEISRLSQDDARGAELIKELDEKTSKLAQELIATGNYRQAAEQLKKLNKSFSQDPETKAVISNYDAYKKAVEEQKKRVDTGKITQTDFDTWDFMIRNQFKGTGYDPATGNYSSINTRPPEENREKEIEDLSLKIAGMLPAQAYETLENLGVEGVDRAMLERVHQYRDLGQSQKEIFNFLSTSDRFRESIDDRGKRDFYYNNETAKMRGKGQEFQDGLVNSVVGNLDNNIRNIAEAKKKDKSRAKEYDVILDNLNTQKNNIITGYNQAKQLGTTDGFAEKLFIEDKRKHFDRISLAAADVVDFKNDSLSLSYQADAGLTAKRDGAKKKFEEIGDITTNITSADPNFKIFTGGSTFTQSENKNAKVLAKTGGDIMKAIWETEKEIVPEKMQQLVGNNNLAQVSKNLATTKVLGIFQKEYTDVITKTNNQIADLSNKMASASNQAERDMYKAEGDVLTEQNLEARRALGYQEIEIQNAVESQIAKTNDPKIKQLYEQYQGNPIGFIQALNKADKEAVEKTNVFYEEQNKKNRIQAEAIVSEHEKNKLTGGGFALSEKERENLINQEIAKLESSSSIANNAIAPILAATNSEESKLLTNITNAYRQGIAFKDGYMVTPLETVVNKSSIAFSKQGLELANKWVLGNSTGENPAKKVETFNPITGTTKIADNFRAYDITGYKTEEPHYAGIDQKGNVILRYTIKDNLAGDKSKVGSAVASHIKTGRQGQADPNSLPDSQIPITQAEITAWKNDNPDDLYVRVEGTSIGSQITNGIKESYEELMTAAELIPGDEGKEMMRKTINNFAPMYLVSDNSRREAYTRYAATLQDAVDNNKSISLPPEGPAAWKDNGNGTYTGHILQYSVDKGEIKVVPYEITRDNKGNESEPKMIPGAASTLNYSGQNLPVALLKMNLIYGTGREEDLVVVKQGYDDVPFVPAFTQTFKGIPANSAFAPGTVIR
jgi:hypothetical protein